MSQKKFPFFSSAICFAVIPHLAYSLPEDPKVIAGSAEIKHLDSHTMQIKASDRTILNYSKFGIGKGEKVKFVQESPSSCVLNKVTSKDPSKILGSLESNGKVFLVNPNGVYFGPESKVNVGSLIVSTLHMADEDFLQGKYEFHLADQIASIQNEGSLIASDLIAFISPQIQNKGLIQAKAAVFAAGKHVALDFAGDGLMQFSVEGSLKEALIEHLGEIQSSNVTMKIPAAKKAISEIVNIDGAEMGEVFTEENGIIKLASLSSIKSDKVILEAAHLEVEGTIDSTSSWSKGGKVHLLGTHIDLTNATIDVSGIRGGGEVLIGGEYQGGGTTPYASTVVMDESSQIFTNALEKGDGGLVVLWSQDRTIFDGYIESKGGALGGNGGLIETSSKGALHVEKGHEDTFSPYGNAGTWLIDPIFLVIGGSCSTHGLSGGSCSFSCSGTCTNTCDNTVCCSIATSSFTGSNSAVVFQGGGCSSGSCTGTIYLDSAITMTGTGSLTFQACPGSTFINMYVSHSITTKGGDVFFNGITAELADITIDTTNGGGTPNGASITLNSLASTSTVSVSLNAGSGGTITLFNDPFNSFKGSINVSNAALVQNTSALTLSNDFTIVSAGAVHTSGISVGGNLSFLSGTPITLLSNSVIQSTGSAKSVSLGSINASSAGEQGLTLSAGSNGSISVGDIGFSTPLSSMNFIGNSIGSTSSRLPGAIITRGPITLSGNTVIHESSEFITNSGGNGADITISGTLDGVFGNFDLNLTAGSGNISLGTIGTTEPLYSITVYSANSVTFQQVITVNVDPPPPPTLPFIDFSRAPVILSSNGILSTTGVGGSSPTGGYISLSTIDSNSSGSYSLTIDAGTEGVLTVGNIGSNTPLGAVTLSSAPNFNASNITTNNQPIVINPSIVLSGDRTFQTGSGSGGSITLSSVNGPYALTLNAGSGAISTGALSNLGALSITGGSISLSGDVTSNSTVTITGSNVSLGSLTSGGDATITHSGTLTIGSGTTSSIGGSFSSAGSGGTDINGNLTAGGSISFTGSLNLGTSLSLTANAGNISLQTITSTTPYALTLNVPSSATVTLGGSVGSISSPLDTLSIPTASQVTFSSITTNNDIAIAIPALLSANSVLTTLTGGDITLSTITGGPGSPFSFTANAGTSGNLTVGAIGDSSNRMLDVSLTGAAVSVGGINSTSVVTLVDAVSLNITAGDISAYAFSESGGGAVTLGNNVTASSTTLSFADNITLTQSATLTAMGNLTVANVLGTGTQVLNLYSTAQSIFAGELGTSANALSTVTLTANGISSVGGIVTAGQSIDIRPPLLITSSPTTLDTTAGGTLPGNTIHFQNTVDAASAGVQGLILQASSAFGSGTVAFDKNVGSKQALAFLTVNGTSPAGINLQGSIVTTGAIEMDPPITLTGNSSMTTSGGAITLSSVDSPGSLYSLTLNASGAGIETGALGSSNALGAVSLTGADITVNGPITTSGNSSNLTITNSGTLDLTASSSPISVGGYFSQTGTGPVSLGNNLTASGGSLSFNSQATLTNNSQLNALANLNLSSPLLGGGFDLNLSSNEGSILAEQLGTSGSPIGTISLNAPLTSSFAGIIATGSIDLVTQIQLFQNPTVIEIVGGGSIVNFINFHGVLNASSNGAQALEIDAANNYIVQVAAWGNLKSLGSVTLSASSAQLGSIKTYGGTIEIAAPVTLIASASNVLMDTTSSGSVTSGADINFSSTIAGTSSQLLNLKAGTTGEITLPEDITSLGSLVVDLANNVNVKNIAVTSQFSIIPHTTLSISGVTTFSAGESIVFGDVDGTVNGAQSLSVETTGPVTLGNLGLSIYLGEVNVLTGSSAIIQSIYTSGEINILPPVTLASSTALNSSFAGGADISLTSLDGTVSGTQNFSVIAGSGDFTLSRDLGAVIPTGSLSIQAASILLEGTKMYAAGTHLYDGSVLINQSAAFRSLGDMTFESTVDPVSANAPDLVLYPGGGILTFQDAVGDAPFGTVAVYNASSFLAEDIFAENLAVGGGLGSIFLNGDVNLSGIAGAILDAGPIFLGGAINTRRIWFRSQGSMTSLGSSQAINTSNNSVLFPQYLNAIKGNIGSLESPIEINTVDSIRVGALNQTDFIGDPDHNSVEIIRFNTPCFVTFNGTLILDGCSTQPSSQNIFNSLAKTLFYVPGIYSSWSWDNLSNPWYFEEMPFYLASNARERTLFYRKTLLYRTDPLMEDALLNRSLFSPKKEQSDFEFTVDLPESLHLDTP